MEHSFWFFCCLMLSITVAGFAQSCLGFGYAIIALAIITFFIDTKMAILIVSLSVVFPLVYMAWGNLRDLDWRLLGLVLAFAAIGMPLGVYVFESLDPLWLMRGTGITILFIACHGLMSRHHQDAERETSYFWGAVAGFASGFLNGSVSIGGPPITTFAVSQPWSPNKYRAFLFCFALIVCFSKAVVILSRGLLDHQTILISVYTIPFGLFGAWLGIQTAKRIDSQRFRKIVLISLVFVSIGILIRKAEKPTDKPIPTQQVSNNVMNN